MAEEHNFEDYAKEVEKYRELMEEIQFHTRKVCIIWQQFQKWVNNKLNEDSSKVNVKWAHIYFR